MILNDLIDLVNKEKRKQERVKAVKNLTMGVGTLVVTVLTIKILIAGKGRKMFKEKRMI